MNYKELKEGQIFNFIDHPQQDIFLKLFKGFVRIPNKFTFFNEKRNFPNSNKDVKLLTKEQIYKNMVLTKEKK